MARTVQQGFDTFLERLTPLPSQRDAAASHRASVEAALKAELRVSTLRDIGSFNNGTGVRNRTDVDLLVSLAGGRPGSSDTALGWVRDCLRKRFPSTPVQVRRPAVAVAFAGGDETWEVVPGFLTSRGGSAYVYDIPGAGSGWIDTAPLEHIAYVKEVNQRDAVKGAAKKLARLAKAWKYYNNVPVSSFYLEMRATQHMGAETSYTPVLDVCFLLEGLNRSGLAAMNDPKHAAERFYPCSSDARKSDALSKLATGATRARKALDAYLADDPNSAFHYLNLLFGQQFPSR